MKRFRSDHRGEYLNEVLEEFFAQKGIQHDLTPPYNHESNGVAERFNRIIQTIVRAMLLDMKNVINAVNNNRRYWAEASITVVYLKNRLPHSAVKGITPYEALYKSKPKISYLQPFGKDCYIYIPEERRLPGSKLLPRTEKDIFFGYTNSHSIYKIHISSRKHTMTVNAVDPGDRAWSRI